MATPRVKSSSESAEKWAARATSASSEYASEAQQASQDWEANARAAAPNFKAAVTAGDIDRRFSSGVQQAGAAKYQRGIQNKGAGRYSGGVDAGKGDYQSGVEPYLQVIASTDLPARRPRGDPANRRRSEAIQDALHKARMARAGAGA